MGQLITKLRENFDYVLFDTPPVLAVTDATLVGKWADGLLMTLQAGKIHRDEAKAATDRLLMGGIRVLGVVLNRFIPRRGSSGGGYRYYYAYQQYGQGEESESGTAA